MNVCLTYISIILPTKHHNLIVHIWQRLKSIGLTDRQKFPGGGLGKKWAEFFSRVLRFQQDNYHKGSSLLLDNFL